MVAAAPNPVHPGARLRDEFMAPLGLSIRKLADTLGVSPRRIRDLTRERARFSYDTASRLEQRFGVSAQVWLDQQRQYDGAQQSTRHRVSQE